MRRENIQRKTVFIGNSWLRTSCVIACSILNLVHRIGCFWNGWLMVLRKVWNVLRPNYRVKVIFVICTHQKAGLRCGFFCVKDASECVKSAFRISRCFNRSVYNAITRHFKDKLRRNLSHIMAGQKKRNGY